MDEMNLSEIAVKIAEENQTRKILLILEELKQEETHEKEVLKKLEEKIKALLNK